ncbi:Nuclear export factor [Mycena chlorophos]|uniref:Nuclear export factor n=1 Tax=Mycena chlorophos TaxID=658473 RepID=A0A8H6SKX6_MYCCL|nr:Nuclear export factor [Mycena chlorophos]
MNGGGHSNDVGRGRGKNRHWSAPGHDHPSRSATTTPHINSDRGRGRGRGMANGGSTESTRPATPAAVPDVVSQVDPVLETPEERERFYQELLKQREIERKTAIAQGKMDDPNVPKRLEDAISIVGTCMDMCPRFERYRRERENNLFEWETIPGTKRVDHKRAVKMYERAAGDKTIPSDLRPPLVLRKTLDYLFHDLMPRGGFSPTYNFIRDRSRSVRNDFTMQHITDALAMECHERCARFHILALYLERDTEGFSVPLEEQQLMNTLQSLKEFYNDQRDTYQSPAELEMRIYHRLIHIRDQVERPEPAPLSQHVAEHPIYKLTTSFRAHVQKMSQPITKSSKLVVDEAAMNIFGELAEEMMALGGGGKGMVFLVACILERLFGKGTVDSIDDIREGASWGDIIDGVAGDGDEAVEVQVEEVQEEAQEQDELDLSDVDTGDVVEEDDGDAAPPTATTAASSSAWPAGPSVFASNGSASAFSGLGTTNAFSNIGFTNGANPAPANAFSNLGAPKSVFSTASAFANTERKSVFANIGSNNPFAAPPANGALFAQPAPATAAPTPPLFAVPPRVQNNPLIPSNTPSPLSLGSTSALPPLSAPEPPSNNIFAPTPTPAAPATPFSGFLVDKGKGRAADSPTNPFSPSQPSTTALNPKAAEFTPSAARPTVPAPLAGPSPPTKPIFGVTPIPLFNGFPTATSTPGASETAPVSKPSPKNTPPLAKIDTSPHVTGSLAPPPAVAGPSSPVTPVIPPPLGKVQPISLPSTPTVPPLMASSSSTLLAAPSPVVPKSGKANPLLGFLKDSLQTSNLGVSGGGMLSPLVIASPSIPPLRNNSLSPAKRPRITEDENESPSRLVGSIKGKGKARELQQEPSEEMLARALEFERRGTGVRECFAVWQRRTTDQAEWADAVKKSERYSQKVRREREAGFGDSVGKRPRNGDESISPLRSAKRKRQTPRRHKYESPRTDEDLAKRFEENKEEHDRRWATGSFLQIARALVKSRCRTAHSASAPFWRLWLSLNPEHDATAIWLETKFDVQGSYAAGGKWETESVFSIPAVPNPPVPEQYPGLIVFECTPLEGVSDDLERKYLVLGDCSRLRDIMEALPPKRHFIPSLLLVVWTAEGNSAPSPLPVDLQTMVEKYLSESLLVRSRVLSVKATTTDLDAKFQDALDELEMDVVGKLVQSLTLKDIFKLFEPALNSFIADWLGNCWSNEQFDWSLYCRLLDAVIFVLNKTASLALELAGATPEERVLPALRLDWSGPRDSEFVFEGVSTWLAGSHLDRFAANHVANDVQSHRDTGREFPTSAFIDHLRSLALFHMEGLVSPDRAILLCFHEGYPASVGEAHRGDRYATRGVDSSSEAEPSSFAQAKNAKPVGGERVHESFCLQETETVFWAWDLQPRYPVFEPAACQRERS